MSFYTKESSEEEFSPYLEIQKSTIPALPLSTTEQGSDFALGVIVGIVITVAAGIAVLFYLNNKGKKLRSFTSFVQKPEVTPEPEVTSETKPTEETFPCKSCGKTVYSTYKTCLFCGAKINQ